ncbi:unnamed protein product [Paramecium primaurelia]|uniref:Uncharacterized protein n=1 Tax=Paramecium primaurelia TaxID=5886 RepID=A0A8S1P0Z4_PARPR|nr:unnamed protein product [Paramecium primaurelia]
MIGNIIQAIGELLNCKVDFLCTAQLTSDKKYFAVVASDRLLFIASKLEKVEMSLEYGKIKGIVISTRVPTMFQIHTDIIIDVYALERKQLIQALRYSWMTDFMHKNFQFKQLPMFKDDIKSNIQDKQPVLPNLMFTKQGKQMFRNKNYTFSLPDEYEATYQDGVYVHKESQQCKIVVQITDPMPTQLLSQLGEKANLQYYSEMFLEIVLKGINSKDDSVKQGTNQKSQDSDEEGKNQEEDDQSKQKEETLDYWIISSHNYKKRSNLMNDISEWFGWELHARTQVQDIFIIILRRIHIPPLFETYQEILFVLYGQEQNAKEQVLVNDRDLLKLTLEQDLEEHAFKNVLRNAIDSLQCKMFIFEKQYQIFIQLSADRLLYNRQTLNFIYNKFKIFPQFMSYALKYLKLLFQRLVLYDKERFLILDKELTQKYGFILNNLKDYMTDGIQIEENLQALFDAFEQASFVRDKSGNEEERKFVWQQKLSNYLGICFDGLLMGSAFSFKDLVPVLQAKVSMELKTIILELFDYCLYAVPKKECRPIKKGNFIKKLEELASNKYQYNVNIAKSLIEANFFSQEVLLQERSGLYSSLICYFLQSDNVDLIVAICRHIINFQAEIKHTTGLTEAMITAFKPISVELIRLYRSHNRTIATLACASLFNLCTNSREFKYIILNDDGAALLVSKLVTKDNFLLHFALKLIYCVMSITQNIEKLLAANLTDYLYKILEGPQIKGCQYDARCLITTCQILSVCLVSEVELRNIDHLLILLYNMVTTQADQYFLDQEESVNLKSEALYVMSKMCHKSAEVKKKINQECVPYLLKLMEKLTYHQVQEKIIMLLCILIKENKEWALEWLQMQIKLQDILTTYHNNDIQSSNYLLSQIKFIDDEAKKVKNEEMKRSKLAPTASVIAEQMMEQLQQQESTIQDNKKSMVSEARSSMIEDSRITASNINNKSTINPSQFKKSSAS